MSKQDRISGSCASRASPHSNLSRSDLENLRSLFEPLRGIESEEPKKDHQDYPKDNYLLPIHPASSEVNYQVPPQRPDTYSSKRSATPSFGTFGENPLETQISDKLEKIYGTYDKRRDHHRRSDRRREQEYRERAQEVAVEERLLRSNYVPENARGQEEPPKDLDEYQYQKQRHLVPYHHRHYHPQKVHSPSHHHPSVSINYQKHPHGTNPTVVYRDDSCNVYESNYQRHRTSRLPSNYHGTVTPSMMSATSSNSSLINHGSSPTMHYRISEAANSSSATSSASPATLLADEQGERDDLRHLPSSNASYDSSLRSHSRMEHMPEHLQHHHRVQYSQKGLRERLEHPENSEPPPPPAPPSPLPMNHHINQHHNHNSATNKASQTKSPGFIGYNDVQVSTVPSKSKCQCHTLQESCRDKRGSECRGNGDVEVTSIAHQPPALPPRPPPRTTRRYETVSTNQGHVVEGTCCKKYVILCSLCGGLSAAVGSLFLAVHAVLSAHTASLALFETVPSYIPGTMLIIMGFFTMLLARRKHRCGLLMKVCGSVGVVCALVCVLVTVTTTVVHMSRLQGLRECVYTVRARSCTCYEASQSKGDPGVLFEGTPHCEVVHGALYACLRALFGVSVAGILACIFSCMLVYQLLSHEKKKMYWEQLELRCRSLYGQGMGVTGVGSAVPGSCGCCNDCGGTGAWWTQTQGNLYTPNPDLAPSRRWRLPWTRSRGPATNPDSNYGFHAQSRQIENNTDNAVGPYSVLSSQAGGPYSVLAPQSNPYTTTPTTYSVLEAPVPLWGPPPPYSDPNSPARRPHIVDLRQQRITKRIENYDNNEPVDYRARVANKRPSDNYENAEDLANSTDPEGGNDGTVKSRRIRKPLKGVENCAFQQESNVPKQSESELYFGDVSSCCGPESSFYDVALENEGERSEIKDQKSTQSKRQMSKKSRHSIHPDMPSNSYTNNEDRNGRTSYLAPDAQYEVIQQGHYSYYSPKSDDEDDSMGDPNQETIREASSEPHEEPIVTKQEVRESKRKSYYQDRTKERKSNHHSSEQCCDENADWQAEQSQTREEDACHSNNV